MNDICGECVDVDEMLKRPGIWIIISIRSYTFVEVDGIGGCWSLRPHDMSRDNPLTREGWIKPQLAYGPFTRSESWVDEKGVTWLPPSAYAYAMVCKARDRMRDDYGLGNYED